MSLKSYIKSSPTFSKLARRPLFYYSYLSKTIKSLQSASVPEREKATNQLLKKALFRALHTPYARNIGLPKSLDEWPICDKNTLQKHYHQMKITGIRPHLKSYSGGTTGIPVQVDLSLDALALEQGLLDYIVKPFSVDWFKSRIAVLRGDDFAAKTSQKKILWKFQNGGRRLHFCSNTLNKDNISDFSDMLKKFNPDILWVYPNVLRQFLNLLEGQNHQINPKLLISSSEIFDSQLAALAIKKLNCRNILDFYGQAERVCAAFSVGGTLYHFVSAYGKVELLFEREENNFDLYRIIGTPYWNKSYGLVRLDTGDLACLPKGLSNKSVKQIALGIHPFLGIFGRHNDHLLSPSGEILVGIDHIQKGLKSISQLQVVQNSTHQVELIVIPKSNFTQNDADQLIMQARKKIPITMGITVSLTDSLNKAPNGKVPFIIKKI